MPATLSTLLFLLALSPTVRADDRGIVGKSAPSWGVTQWLNLPPGQASLDIKNFRGKVLYLFCFQSWCPGCHSHGFPALNTMMTRFAGNDDVKFVAVQTAFEGFSSNNFSHAATLSEKHNLKIPVGQSGNKMLQSMIMRNYRTGGTPWTIIVDRSGVVRFNDFQVDINTASKLINTLVAEAPAGATGKIAPKTPAKKQGAEFRLTLDPAIQTSPYTGRVFVLVSSDLKREPRLSINNWFSPPHIIHEDLRGADPSKPITLGAKSPSFPTSLASLPAGQYHVQCVARRSTTHPVPGKGPGDLYSNPQVVTLDPDKPQTLSFKLDQVVKEQRFEQTDRVRLFEMISPSLSAFHGRPTKIRAGVVLPEGWSESSSKKHPALYWIGGFGSNHHTARFLSRLTSSSKAAGNTLLVVPDPQCYRGHSVFADSKNNGPWGKALVEELIPAIEKKFHGTGEGRHRYVTGISSGGWSSLWLQVTYPGAFNGCWSHVPDPVDFRNFQRANLYKPGENIFKDASGNRRPLARRGGEVTLWYDDFVAHEEAVGPGGQIHSFEAVFSNRRADGTPQPLFDRSTGDIDSTVAHSWERFDIRLTLERNWKTLGPQLRGKLHIYAGEKDTFYLEGAVRLLKASLEKLGSDAEVKIIEGMSHQIHMEAIAPMFETIDKNFRAESH